LPNLPIITRCGTWIEFVCFIAENFNEIKLFAQAISNSGTCSYDFYNLLTKKSLIKEIKLVRKYKYLTEAITKLEDENLSTEEQINLFKMQLKL
jgi:hypothetical protein